MKRLILILTIMALLAALPGTAAAAKKCENPPCDKPPPGPEEQVCAFDGLGVLTNWDGSSAVRCEWTVPAAYRGADKPFTFEIQAPPSGEATMMAPYLAVTDLYPSGGDRCVYFWENGWHDLSDPELVYPDPATGSELWSFTLSEDGNCVDDNDDNPVDKSGQDHEFALTVFAQKVRSGPVQLVWTSMLEEG